MAQRWSGSIHLEAGWALFAGGVGDNAAHRHQALQIAVAGSDGVSAEVEGRAVAGRWLAIAARARHRVWCDRPLAFLLYLDPMSDAGRAVAARLGARPALAGPELPAGPLAAADPRPPESWDEAHSLRRDCLRAVGADESQPSPMGDVRIRAAIARIEAEAGSGPIPLAALARGAGLSESRFSSLFRSETGMAPRAHARWARLRLAVAAISAGRSATQAAAEAGFSDAAHLARTFRAMFGTTLSASALGLSIARPE